MSDLIFGYSWEQLQAMQQKGYVRPKVNTNTQGDYGADPMGDGTFRMVPSGDIVDYKERNRRLNRK